MKNAVNWFEIPVVDLKRASEFYEFMLDTKLVQEQMNGMDFAIFPYDKTSVSGCLIKCDYLTPSDQGTLVYLNAQGMLDEALARAEERGAKILFPKTNIGENGFIAHISDCEGNKVALHSM